MAAQNKRKEKARVAARARRSQEANIMMEMASELHITQEKMRRIDKATIVKLAIDYLKAFDVLCNKPQAPRRQTQSYGQFVREAQTCGFSGARENSQSIDRTNSAARQQNTKREEQSIPNDISNIENNDAVNNNNNNHSTHPICNKHARDETRQGLESNHLALVEAEQLLTSLELPTKIIKIDQEQQEQLHHLQHHNHNHHHQRHDQQEISPHSAPVLTTSLVFSPKTLENTNEHYLMIDEKADGNSKFVLKPDTEISDEDDLTHLAPQAGDISISLNFEQLDQLSWLSLSSFSSSMMRA